MIESMKDLALLALNHACRTQDLTMPLLRRDYGAMLAPLLVESSEKTSRVYLLQAVPGHPGTVRLWAEELDDAKRVRLPFNRPSGAQSAAIGPVFKRTFKRNDNPPYGPSPKIQTTTRKAFETLAESTVAWSAYFREVVDILFKATTLVYQDQHYPVGPDQPDPHVFAAALRLIPEKETVFLTVVDTGNRWPGDRSEYHAYLAQELAEIKYVTDKAPARSPASCPLCGAVDTTLYPNAVKGAGLNFCNMDREGAFPGLDIAQAWKGYGLCLNCADLLYIFKNHLLTEFRGRIAGDPALLLPALLGNESGKCQFIADWKTYIQHLESDKLKAREEDLLDFFSGRDDAHVVLHILWAVFGQVVDEVRGHLTDILPSRLRELSKRNAEANQWQHALAPRSPVDEAKCTLSLAMLQPLLKRPGGKRTEKSNASVQLFALKRQLADALYHGRPLDDMESCLWDEIMTTARCYLDDIRQSDNSGWLLYEGVNKKGDRYLTLAGWVRHLARFLHYLHLTGVLPVMDYTVFAPQMERLKPYFEPGSGINSDAKAFAFLLGILYGKLLQVQSARGVNVGANALTWLKRLNLAGRDLPELYCKIREKLLSYETEANADVRALIHELGRLGPRLGDAIDLDTTPTCYFLLLGQSIAVEVLPSKAKKDDDDNEHHH